MNIMRFLVWRVSKFYTLHILYICYRENNYNQFSKFKFYFEDNNKEDNLLLNSIATTQLQKDKIPQNETDNKKKEAISVYIRRHIRSFPRCRPSRK